MAPYFFASMLRVMKLVMRLFETQKRDNLKDFDQQNIIWI